MGLKNRLIQEKEGNFSGGLYYWTQILFAYNSNHIEGSRITEEQTRQIFDSGTFFSNADEPIKTDDILETLNHFKAYDFILEHADEPLSHDFVKKLHKILKRNTSQDGDELYNVGGYKKFNNQIGDIHAAQTTPASDVEKEMEEFFTKYQQFQDDGLYLAQFHYDFERIHPHSDGNGRIGRLILYKELLRMNGTPLVIRDENRAYYLRGLQEFENDPQYLADTLLFEQDYYQGLIKQFLE